MLLSKMLTEVEQLEEQMNNYTKYSLFDIKIIFLEEYAKPMEKKLYFTTQKCNKVQ